MWGNKAAGKQSCRALERLNRRRFNDDGGTGVDMMEGLEVQEEKERERRRIWTLEALGWI